ncbi:purine-nucleoside phosphorylase [Defluviitalea phaphyphila]|uniref:purine-nucleoside phosphorylase n=1 Tax=Defluviitalea phaphyphila TaxID=1473580 RepID=UPI00072FD11C|nr:purine-nucleoside phosphorylase [Defluviitalea phaphyphila]
MEIQNQIEKASEYILNKSKFKPEIGLILGSGLGDLGNEIESKEIFPYQNIPYFPISTVEGHVGQLIIGELQGKTVIAMQGRFHYYEGYHMNEVTFPIRVMKKIGVKTLIVTNAAGAVNENYKPGDLMIIKDHINFAGINPLIGKNLDEYGMRFPDMSNAYKEELRNKVKEAAKELEIDIREGVYTYFTGPSYETPAEIKMVRILGGDAVGMSTVPEVITAIHSGIDVIGISCMTNMAAGILDQPLNHEEVIETSKKVKEKFIKLMKVLIKNL